MAKLELKGLNLDALNYSTRESAISLLKVAEPKVETLDIPLNDIAADPEQSRRTFDDTKLSALAKSIERRGLIQPIVVRLNTDADEPKYLIIAGERRFRAHQLLERQTIRAQVYLDIEPKTIKLFNLVENLNRVDLRAIDELDSVIAIVEAYLGHDTKTFNKLLLELTYIEKGRKPLESQSPLHENLRNLLIELNITNFASFHSNRMFLLDLPEALLDAIRYQELEPNLAKQIARLPEALHRDFIEQALLGKFSYRTLQQEVDKRLGVQPAGFSAEQERLKKVSQLVNKNYKTLDKTKKREYERLMNALIALFE